MILTHSGNAGDIVFSIPTINHLTGGKKTASLYIKAAQYIAPYGDQCNFVKDLLLLQPSIKEVIPFEPKDNNWSYHHWFGLKPDYDLDKARLERNRGRIHIIKRYFDAFGIQGDYKQPFLNIDDKGKRDERYALIHCTSRWNGLQYDWGKIYDEARDKHGKVYFIGFHLECENFKERFRDIEHLPTANLLEMARLIRDCGALYCNQGVALTIAQGLGKQYYLAPNGDRTNCLLFTKNEHRYGREYLAPYNTLSMAPDTHFKR